MKLFVVILQADRCREKGKKDAFIFMADRWIPSNPIDGRYVWLPIQFKDGFPVLEWKDNWKLDEL